MFFAVILLAVIAWLLWTIHQDLGEANNRQLTLRTELARLANRVEQLLETTAKPAVATTSEPVSLNRASKTRLRSLPGIGAVVAGRIVESRPLHSVEQLREIEGVTERIFESVKALVTVD